MVKSITPHLVYRLNGMHHVVAQVGVVNGDHVFALQLLHSAHDMWFKVYAANIGRI